MAVFPAIRVTQYRVTPGRFTGTSFVLKLNRPLLPNYFVMLSPSVEGNTIDANQVGVVVQADPFGTGGLTLQAADDEIQLIRLAGGTDWTGTIQIVESERDGDGNGFRLLDVAVMSPAASTAIGVVSAQAASPNAWADIDQVVLFGGLRGGGAAVPTAGLEKYPSILGRLFPSGDNVINLERFENTGAADRVVAALWVVYVVEWGSGWTVNRATVTGGNFGLGTVTGEWNSAAIVASPATLTRAATWLWAAGYTEGDTPGDSFAGAMLALGDGVAENATEDTVAVNYRLDPVSSSTEVYALTHPDAVVDWSSEAVGRGTFATFDKTVPAPVADESRSFGAPHGLDVVAGRRIALVSTSSAGGALAAWPAVVAWYPQHIADAVLRFRRFAPSAPSAWGARIQSIDLGAVLATGDTVAAGPLDAGAGAEISSTTNLVLIPDHKDQAVANLLLQLRQPRITSLARALAEGAQTMEDELFGLIVNRELGAATGASLEQWGAVVGEQRGGLTDAEYRRFIEARILANNSGGSTDEMIKIWELVTGPSVSVQHFQIFPATFHLQVVRAVAMTDEVTRRVVRIMDDAKPSGIAMTLVEAVVGYYGFSPDPDASPLDVGTFARTLT